MLYIGLHFPPHLTHVTAIPCETKDVLNCYITLKYIVCNKLYDDWIRTQYTEIWFIRIISYHDRSAQNCQNWCSKYAPLTLTHALVDDDESRISLSLQESDGVVFSMRWGAVLLTHKKLVLRKCACLAVTSSEKSCRDSLPSSLWHQIWAIRL